jgi:signal transduction histidine kinase
LPNNLCRLPPNEEAALFRVAQECLTNVQRHSGSQVAIIRIMREADSLVLEVADEGCGFALVAQEMGRTGSGAGLGLRGMKERIRHLGGCLEAQSDSRGTTIRARLPMREARR